MCSVDIFDWQQHVVPESIGPIQILQVQQGSPKMSDTKPFTTSNGLLHGLRNIFGLKNIKITGERN